MGNNKTIELREYQSLSYDKKNILMDDEDLVLQEKLENKKFLTIRSNERLKKIEFKAESKIGVAQFTNFSVIINPKFTNIQNLVKLINYAWDVEVELIPESEIKFKNENNMLVEIIISSFLHHCKNLIMQGLYKSYVLHQDTSMPCLRGKLLLVQQLQNDATLNAKFACEYDELEYNNLENQILLYCLYQCRDLTNFDSKKNEFNSMIQQMEQFVEYKKISMDHFKQLNYTRLNQYYEKTHDLCKIIIQNMGISDFYKQETSFVNSFFIDMNKIFEKFFFKLIAENHPLTSNKPKSSLSWKSKLGEKKSNEPDGFIYEENGVDVKYILDTKYKDSVSADGTNNIKREDLRQMLDYMSHQGKNEGYLIYPKTSKSLSDEYKAENRDYTIKIRFIDIDAAMDLISIPDSKIRTNRIFEFLQKILD
ncbi:McrC family protein [Nitrosopumilus sp.]|nr:McrC family protein [Nitrosopumilus sp.]